MPSATEAEPGLVETTGLLTSSFLEVSIFSPQGASTSVPKLMAAFGGFFSITRLLASLSRDVLSHMGKSDASPQRRNAQMVTRFEIPCFLILFRCNADQIGIGSRPNGFSNATC